MKGTIPYWCSNTAYSVAPHLFCFRFPDLIKHVLNITSNCKYLSYVKEISMHFDFAEIMVWTN